MRLTLRWVNRNQWHASVRKLQGAPNINKLEEAVGRAAIRVQQAMREELERMIYAQPPAAGGYIRTRTLWRSTHAASPDTDHGADESRAAGGSDLAATDPTTVTERRGKKIVSEVGSWISYSEHVHAGANQPSPRPFVAATLPKAERILQEEVERAVREMATVR
jgi:hypothetical protein